MANAVTDWRFLRLTKVVDLMRTFESEIPGQVISVFFYVCAHNGCMIKYMHKELGIAQSSISRCTDWLSDYHRLGKPGMGLIIKKFDPADKRIKRVWLTPKGQLVKQQIEELISDV
jgi:DNA-binding MarR family transcriptional regulator